MHKFRFKTLMLLKLLMLQRRVRSPAPSTAYPADPRAHTQTMFYAAHTPIESLCTFQYSLVALIPCQSP